MFYGIEKRIGKKVWLYEERPHYDFVLNQEKVWTVESLHEPDEKHSDYYFTITDGTESRDAFWYEVVVIPIENTDELARINEYLHDNGFYDSGIWYEGILDTQLVRIAIEWGDWKHEHGWLRDLMKHLGYEEFGCVVTEEDGSDCYSADHIFVHKDNPRYNVLMSAKKIFS